MMMFHRGLRVNLVCLTTSQAWLWRLVAVGANGSALAAARAPDAITRYEATAVCVARNGIAVSQPAVLQVKSWTIIRGMIYCR